jgi:hypothetical protein
MFGAQMSGLLAAVPGLIMRTITLLDDKLPPRSPNGDHSEVG